ncbi:hypothetical protein MP213Fo_10760 [Pseudochrobactrum sp. MP213Fo]
MLVGVSKEWQALMPVDIKVQVFSHNLLKTADTSQ